MLNSDPPGWRRVVGDGELGNATNNNTATPNPTPTLVTLPRQVGTVTQIAAGGGHSLVVTSSGQLYAFGYNFYGQPGSATNNSTFVKAGTRPFTIKIAPIWQGHAGMEWDNTFAHKVGHGVRVVPCSRGDANGKWIWYAGGFYVDAPTWLALTVTIGNWQFQQHVPLGRACP